jgi:hypothetical protein
MRRACNPGIQGFAFEAASSIELSGMGDSILVQTSQRMGPKSLACWNHDYGSCRVLLRRGSSEAQPVAKAIGATL